MDKERVCWTCGHFAFGCFVNGDFNNSVKVDDYCSKWCEEGTSGTVTDISQFKDFEDEGRE